jgi:Tfp pilus assembly protein PilF
VTTLPLCVLLLLAPQAAPAPLGVTPSARTEAAPAGDATALVQARLRKYRQHRYAQAAADFEQALTADPQSAAAAWYLAYAWYKVAEPKRPFDPGKQRAAEMFGRAYSLDPGFRPDWGVPRH